MCSSSATAGVWTTAECWQEIETKQISILFEKTRNILKRSWKPLNNIPNFLTNFLTFFDNEFSLDKPNLKGKKNRKKETKRRIIGRPIERQLRLFIFSFLNCSCERPDFDYIYASDDEFEI